MASRRQQKPRSHVPVNYQRVRLDPAVIFRRIEAGFALRHDHRGVGSIYDVRGLKEV